MRLPSHAFSSLQTTLQRCQLHKPNLLTLEAKRLLRRSFPLPGFSGFHSKRRPRARGSFPRTLAPTEPRETLEACGAMSHLLSRALPRGWPQVSAALLRHLFDLCAVDVKCCEEECDRSEPLDSQSEKKRRALSFQTNTSIINRQKSL